MIFSRLFSSSSAPPLFNKILIANRGEIACRIIKSAKKLNIKTVAIYSTPDINSLHVRLADEAYCVGPAHSSKSYLSIQNIIAAAKQSGAQAIHPGYGFLSENAAFVKALDQNNITFIGPPASAMAAMGDKIQSKIFAKQANVSTIPGFNGVVENPDHAVEIARQIGYPVMVKASAGGGGKGMRIAYSDNETREAFRLSSAEALSSFGDNRLLVEKFIEHPRHIEIQLLADLHGNAIYLPERECSIQRRNQKVIEEAPSVHLDDATRIAMGEQAVALAKAVNYASAGTCEFLVDPNKNFYFLEMNTRLQVEHPVTELITGLDLVEHMIRVAAGLPLSINQSDIKRNGWAFESRVYAEDPEKYLPSIGTLSLYKEPKTSISSDSIVRSDSGVVEGSEISVYYDPLICKLCTHAPTRQAAITEMEHALDTYLIKGVTHNIPLLRDVYSHPRFQEGRLSTAFLAEEYPSGFKGHVLTDTTRRELLAIAAYIHARRDLRNRTWIKGAGDSLSISSASPNSSVDQTQWDLYIAPGGSSPDANDHHHVQVTRRVNASDKNTDLYDITVDDVTLTIDADWTIESPIIHAKITPKSISSSDISSNSIKESSNIVVQYLDVLPIGYRLTHYGTKFNVSVRTHLQHDLYQYIKPKPKPDFTRIIVSPMPGTVVSVSVKVGDVVSEGSELVVVEAMKMQNVIRAVRVGKVKSVKVEQGATVAGDEVLIEFE